MRGRAVIPDDKGTLEGVATVTLAVRWDVSGVPDTVPIGAVLSTVADILASELRWHLGRSVFGHSSTPLGGWECPTAFGLGDVRVVDIATD